ncbi:hypothetical protein MC7420_2922 [Coleofasciculus chthonoplastes PCC 7420]|uniref:Uncharacterized protein n=1 Tax=Coleofasciculus chthonoplastes PCC 7420 TaxID=118168 RepID=B4VK65_9CYAN|nr:hypothetical protein [Coleofasciculus chthonoplastes]EDX77598.1 hypothetical protein MC7420_2922 [Coleofasciculus chthonoplastes PCC 7420]
MVSQTNEQALENLIENHLLNHAGYHSGNSKDFDTEFAIDKRQFWEFLETTQSKELDKLRDSPDWQRLILERLNRKIKKNGVLSLLKKGLAIDDANLTLFYSLPYNDLNPQIQANFAQNRFSLTRQLYFSASDSNPSIDLACFAGSPTPYLYFDRLSNNSGWCGMDRRVAVGTEATN